MLHPTLQLWRQAFWSICFTWVAAGHAASGSVDSAPAALSATPGVSPAGSSPASSTSLVPVQVELLPLSSQFLESGALRFRVHTNAIHWTWELGNARARFGGAMTGAPDLDGDGHRELAIGAVGYDRTATNPVGLVVIFPGVRNGFRAHEPLQLPAPPGLSGFGRRILGIHGDGGGRPDELWVGAYPRKRGSNATDELLMFSGSSTGLQQTPFWTSRERYPDSGFGVDFESAGDVNGDGLNDFIVGASTSTKRFEKEGAAFVFHGRRGGTPPEADWAFWGGETSMEFGSRVAAAGDVNGDGFADVLISSPLYPRFGERRGRVWLFLGSSTGLASKPALILDGPERNSDFGECIATAGDLDGDGCAEFLVGAPALANRSARRAEVSLFRGSTNPAAIDRIWKVTAEHTDFRLGASLAVVGDVDGDGFADLAVGAPNSYQGSRSRGRVMIYRGKRGTFHDNPDWIVSATNYGRIVGRLVCPMGDVNRDGLADFAIGIPGWTTSREELGGRVDLFFGARHGYRRGEAFPADGINSVRTSPTDGAEVVLRPAASLPVIPTHDSTANPNRIHRSWIAFAAAGSIGAIVGVLLLVRRSAAMKRRQAIENERERMARDLHDHLGPQLSRLALLSDRPDGGAPQSKVGDAAHQAIETMRELVWVNNPKNDSVEKFADFLTEYASSYFRDTSIQVNLDVPIDLPPTHLRSDLRHNLFLTVKEALQNILRHSSATNAWLLLRLEECVLRIVIKDDGQGFHPGTPAEPSGRPMKGGNGLKNMRHRMEAVGGSFRFDSKSGEGTTVRVEVRLAPSRTPK